MSEQPESAAAPAPPRDDAETGLVADTPGPSGTGEQTDAGADPDATDGPDA